MKYRKTSTVALLAAALCGVMTQSAQADAGIHTYTDVSWSFSVPEYGDAYGSSLHYEGSGYSGITAQITFESSEFITNEKTVLQRDLSWVGDGWVTIATVVSSARTPISPIATSNFPSVLPPATGPG